MTGPIAADAEVSAATHAWARRVRRVGGFIQTGFAGFWLLRGGLTVGAPTGTALAAAGGLATAAVLVYGIRRTAHRAPRPTGAEARSIERAITIATIVQLAASFAAPAVVLALGRDDWVLPSIAVTIGPLLLWLDRRLSIPRYRPVGWLLIAGPVVLVALTSGTTLAVSTGIGAGALLLATATAGFHDLDRRAT